MMTSAAHRPGRPAGTARSTTSASHATPGSPSAGVVALVGMALPVSLGISATSLLLPTAADDLGTSIGAATWLLTIYGWGMAMGMPLLAALAGRLGRRVALAAGCTLLALGAGLVLAAPPLPAVVAGRAALAAGAGATVVLAMGIAREMEPERARQRRLGLITAGIGMSGATGPLIGSAVAEASSWRVALALPALSLVAAPAIARHAGGAPAPASERFDATGAGLLTAVVTAVFLALQGPAGGLSAPALLAVAAIGLGAVVALAFRVRARPRGFLPAPVIGNRPFVVSSALVLSIATINFALIYAAPQLLAAQTGWAPTRVGTVLVPAAVTGAALSWAMAGVHLRLGFRRTALALTVTAATAALLAGLAPAAPVLLLGAAAGAFAAAAAQGVLVASATATLPHPLRTQAIGLFNLAFQFGSVVGPALLAMLTPVVGLAPALGAAALFPLATMSVTRAAARTGRNQTV